MNGSPASRKRLHPLLADGCRCNFNPPRCLTCRRWLKHRAMVLKRTAPAKACTR